MAGKEEQISFRVDSDLKKKFDLSLVDNGETAAAVLRSAIQAYLDPAKKRESPKGTVLAPVETTLLQDLADYLANPRNKERQFLANAVRKIIADK